VQESVDRVRVLPGLEAGRRVGRRLALVHLHSVHALVAIDLRVPVRVHQGSARDRPVAAEEASDALCYHARIAHGILAPTGVLLEHLVEVVPGGRELLDLVAPIPTHLGVGHDRQAVANARLTTDTLAIARDAGEEAVHGIAGLL